MDVTASLLLPKNLTQEEIHVWSLSLKNDSSNVELTKSLQESPSNYFNPLFWTKCNDGHYESEDDNEDEISRSATETGMIINYFRKW